MIVSGAPDWEIRYLAATLTEVAMVSDPPGHAGMEAHVPRQGFVHVRLEPAALQLRLIDRDGTIHYRRRLEREVAGD